MTRAKRVKLSAVRPEHGDVYLDGDEIQCRGVVMTLSRYRADQRLIRSIGTLASLTNHSDSYIVAELRKVKADHNRATNGGKHG